MFVLETQELVGLILVLWQFPSLQRMAESRKNFRVHAHFTSRVPGAASQSRAPGALVVKSASKVRQKFPIEVDPSLLSWKDWYLWSLLSLFFWKD